ncbi:MAG: hypothetical protein ACTSQJ_11525 [Promethearchaeota archaeon]
MANIIIDENAKVSFTLRVRNLLKETKALQIVKSANMLIDLFGLEKAFKRIKPKRIGQQIEMLFPAINASINFTLVSKREDFKCNFGKPKNPVSTIVINVKEDKILKMISDILVLKDNIFGLLKILPKMITGKLKIKGSLFAAILLCRCMMIGKHEIYKGQL